eukprot:CAMPEP_0202970340 /NCGR_PEP_ID=MMETSP1396-20130829/16296_1 /ASSEMBLY_ACC=CAM_ASM_000872 /TAXON_ID= /ORGANISM="Pseudokeronopsis sp., Strain Brazil" /LENGTH=107 /DNA_ID=CAMNT_0049698761 /DNA_START=481 /DNA_END=801 /DNA_ORIENTATION=-
MDRIPKAVLPKHSPYASRGLVLRRQTIRRPHYLLEDGDGVLADEFEAEDDVGGDEGDEVLDEGVVLLVFVQLPRLLLCQLQHPHLRYLEPTLLDDGDNLAYVSVDIW